MSFDLSAYMDLFREEAEDYVRRLNEGLLALEREPDDRACIDDIFRAAHGLKGSARMMEQADIADVAHVLEDLLDGLRSGRFPLDTPLTESLLRGVDAVAELIRVAATAEQPRVSAPEAVAALTAAKARLSAPSTALSSTPGGAPKPGAKRPPDTLPAADEAVGRAQPSPFEQPAGQAEPPASSAASHADAIVPEPTPGSACTEATLHPHARQTPAPSLRVAVPVARLDRLLRLAAQVLSRRDVERDRAREVRALARLLLAAQEAVATQPATALRRLAEARATADRLARAFLRDADVATDLAEELYFEASRARMVPVATLFQRFTRLVRDIERAAGKEVHLVLAGTETELDKRLLDELHDPLLHLVRNAVDHGIEAPEVRRQRGKPTAGTVRLSARTHGDRILIEVQDDGAGLDPARFRAVAVQRKVLSAEEAARLSDEEAVALMFRPGFTTREEASQFSGRGVGMDAVKTSLAGLEGQIRVRSQPGEGTMFTLSLPLSLAAMRALLVSTVDPVYGQQVYALPASAVERCEWLPPNAVRAEDHHPPAALVDERLVPVASLAAMLGGRPVLHGPTVLVRDGDSRLLLTVDALLGETVIVVEPLGKLVEAVPSVSGGAILPDGGVALALHIPTLFWGVSLSNEAVHVAALPMPADPLAAPAERLHP